MCFCGCSLKTASLIIAFIQMIVASSIFFAGIIIAGIVIEAGVRSATENASHTTSYRVSSSLASGIGPGIAVLIVVLIISVFMFYLGHTLRRGAEEEDLSKCRTWFFTTAIFHVIGIFLLIGMIIVIIFTGKIGFTMQNISFLIGLLALVGLLVYSTFSLWVVHEFMNSIKSGQTFDTFPAAVYNTTAGGVCKA